MNKHEGPELSQRLAELADALGGRSPSPAGLLVWIDALKELSMDQVKTALTEWPKRNAKMPAPLDILKLARETAAFRRETEAAKLKDGAEIKWAPTKYGLEASKAIRQMVSGAGGIVAGAFLHIGGRGPADDHKEWAKVLKVKEESGESLSMTQKQAWREALGCSDQRNS